jgi:hypothetical protein
MRASLILLTLFAAEALAQDEPRVAADESATAIAQPAVAATSTTATASSATAMAAAAPATPPAPDGVKAMSGMSILGNEEAPKSLVIVPWKSSRLGDGLGVTNALDERPRPLDREVFMRELHFYELRSGDGK